MVDEEIDAATADGLRGANTQQSLTSLLNFIQQEKIVSCKKDKLFVSLLKAPMFVSEKCFHRHDLRSFTLQTLLNILDLGIFITLYPLSYLI